VGSLIVYHPCSAHVVHCTQGLVDYGEEEEEEEEGMAMEQAPSSSTRRPLSPDPPTTPTAQQHGSKRPRLSGGVKRKGVRWAGPELLEDVFLFYKDRPIGTAHT
jgi:hypothetical protein